MCTYYRQRVRILEINVYANSYTAHKRLHSQLSTATTIIQNQQNWLNFEPNETFGSVYKFTCFLQIHILQVFQFSEKTGKSDFLFKSIQTLTRQLSYYNRWGYTKKEEHTKKLIMLKNKRIEITFNSRLETT